MEPGVYQWGNNTNLSTSCVAALMDVNGTKRPDKTGKDIILLNASTFGNRACIRFTVNGTTYKRGCPFEPTPLTGEECLAMIDEGKIQRYASFWSLQSGIKHSNNFKAASGYFPMRLLSNNFSMAI